MFKEKNSERNSSKLVTTENRFQHVCNNAEERRLQISKLCRKMRMKKVVFIEKMHETHRSGYLFNLMHQSHNLHSWMTSALYSQALTHTQPSRIHQIIKHLIPIND